MRFASAHAWAVVIAMAATSQAGAQRVDTIVKMAGPPLHRGVATLTQEMSIGAVDGPDEYLFGQISHVAVGSDGTVYVFDIKAMQLRAYDARGTFLRNIGRRGRGPGEYVSSSGIAVGHDGRVYQWDTGKLADQRVLPDWTVARQLGIRCRYHGHGCLQFVGENDVC